jgi:hypothetical protein
MNKALTKGFIATTAVIIVGIFAMFMAVNVSINSWYFADSVSRRALRMQSRFNAQTCADLASIILAKDRGFVGDIELIEFGCSVSVKSISINIKEVYIVAELSGIHTKLKRSLYIDSDQVTPFGTDEVW